MKIEQLKEKAGQFIDGEINLLEWKTALLIYVMHTDADLISIAMLFSQEPLS